MFVQEVSIELKNPEIDREVVIDQMEFFIGTTFRNGQSQHNYGPDTYISDGRLIWLTCTVEKNSLAPKNDNTYVKKWRRDMETLCGAKFRVRLLGEHAAQDKKVCRCRKPTSYILWTNFISRVSPLDCGDCGGNVPLYRIPKPPEPDSQEYNFVHHWEKAYQACDELQMDCGFGERWGERQMQEHTSGLSQRGRDACQQIEKATGVPVYYYLYNCRRITGDQDERRPCPNCGGDWLLEEPWHSFDFCCDHCRLVSQRTYNRPVRKH